MDEKLTDSYDIDKATRNFEKAAECCGQGRYNAAMDLLLKGIKACPSHSESHRLLGQIYFMQHDTEKAVDAVLEALRIDPKNMWALILMGNIFAKDKDKVDVAESYYKKVLEYYPENAIAINNVAGVYLQRENYEECIKLMKRAIELDESYINSYYGLSLAFYKKGDYQKAFEIALDGAKLGVQRKEDKDVRQELLKLLLSSAQDACDAIDYEAEVFKVAADIEKQFDVKIQFVEEPKQDTLAHLQFADFYHTSAHVVKYKKELFFCHYILHELMHLEMMLQAKQNNSLKVIGFKQKNLDAYMNDYQRHFGEVRKSLGSHATDDLAKQLFKGMSLQVMNCPLDLFVEQRIYEKALFRPLQLQSLFHMEQQNIQSVEQTANVKEFPQQVKDINKQLDIVSSLMLQKLYSLNFVARYKPSQNMLKNANAYFDKFNEMLDSYSPGDEYRLFEHFATYLGVIKYFDVDTTVSALQNGENENLQTESDRRQEIFKKVHDPQNADPMITMTMASYMVAAMEYFDKLLPEDVKKIAFEIAMVGQNGISPSSETGYDLRNIPGKHFSGYELLAYYYVSWARVAPEMLSQLRLPFDDAYAIAKKMYNKRN